MYKTPVCVAAVALVSLTFAAPVQADDMDYVNFLDDKGVYYESISDIIDIGKLTCRGLRNGLPVQAVYGNLQQSFDFAPAEAAAVVVSAAAMMCDDQKARVQAWASGGGKGTTRE